MRVTPQTAPELVGRCQIEVNGYDVTDSCVMADDEQGKVEVLCRDEVHHNDWKRTQRDGHAHLTPDADDRLCVIKVRGHVVIMRID